MHVDYTEATFCVNSNKKSRYGRVQDLFIYFFFITHFYLIHFVFPVGIFIIDFSLPSYRPSVWIFHQLLIPGTILNNFQQSTSSKVIFKKLILHKMFKSNKAPDTKLTLGWMQLKDKQTRLDEVNSKTFQSLSYRSFISNVV